MDDASSSAQDGLRPLDWRLLAAQRLAQSDRFLSICDHDDLTRQVASYLRSERVSPAAEGAAPVYPHRFRNLKQAFELRTPAHDHIRATVEALLLTQLSSAEIAVRIGSTAACVGWYAAIFFDVRDRLHLPHFILAHVIDGGSRTHAATWIDYGWKLIAYLCGHTALEELIGIANIKEISDLPIVRRQETKLIAREALLRLARKLPVNQPETLMRLLTSVSGKTAASGDDEAASLLGKHVHAMLKAMPFRVGPDDNPADPLHEFEHIAAELTADEMIFVAMGGELPWEKLLKELKFPEPPQSEESCYPIQNQPSSP